MTITAKCGGIIFNIVTEGDICSALAITAHGIYGGTGECVIKGNDAKGKAEIIEATEKYGVM